MAMRLKGLIPLKLVVTVQSGYVQGCKLGRGVVYLEITCSLMTTPCVCVRVQQYIHLSLVNTQWSNTSCVATGIEQATVLHDLTELQFS